jgi:hypothetical protein
MITWRKLMGWAQFILPNVIVVVIDCCSNTPRADSITPTFGFQGTTFDVAITGSRFVDCKRDPGDLH